MSTRKQRANTTIREQFIAKGCDPHMLDSLLGEYRRRVYGPSYGTESRSTIKKLKTLHERLNTIAAEIEQVQAKPLKFLCGHSLTRYWVRSGFLVDTTLIRSEAKKLKEAANSLSRLTTKRKDVRREAINHLYVCCCCVPGERKKARAITYSDVADLLDEYETKKGIANKDKPVVENAGGKAVTRVIARRKLKEEQRCQPTIASKIAS